MMNMTIASMTLRGLVSRRRAYLLGVMPALLVGFSLLARAMAPGDEWVEGIALGLGTAVILPVTALIVAAAALSSEIEDGTIVHVLAKPLPRREILLAKYVVAAAVTFVSVGIGMFAVGMVADSTSLGLGLVAATAIGALAYTAVFLLLSVVSRHPVLVGLVYILVWEGLLGNLVAGTRVLSIQQYAVTVAQRVADTSLFTAGLSLQVALLMTAAVTIAATVFAIDRLRSFSVTGETT